MHGKRVIASDRDSVEMHDLIEKKKNGSGGSKNEGKKASDKEQTTTRNEGSLQEKS